MSMHRFVIIKTKLFLMFALLAPANAFSADQEKLARTMYEKHILPRYEQLVNKMKTLNAGVSRLCSAPSEQNYSTVLTDYKSALLSWSHIEHIRFGPVVENYRYERFAYWPDIKGRGLRKVRSILKKKDASVLSVESLQKKSIAFQGLTALEYLLYGKDKEVLTTQSAEGKFRCGFSRAITENLQAMSQEVLAEWQPGQKYQDAFLSPAANKVHKSYKEITGELFQSYVAAYARYRQLKILRPLGLPKKKTPNARLAPYWRSGLTVDVIRANMTGLKEMFLFGGFQELTSQSHPDLKESVMLSVNNGLRILKGINVPISDIIADERKRKKFKFISSILGVMRGHTGLAIVKAADLTIGFNADDGD